MSERSSYTPGTPSWTDLASHDLDASAEFYTGLFGWTYTPSDDPAAGGYGMFTQDGRAVAGMGPAQDPNMPSMWSTYVSVADVGATAEAVAAAGGQVILPPMEVLDAGSMAVFADTIGAFISVWQPNQHIGSELVNEPVSPCWNELNCREVAAAEPFYSAVFGWDFVEQPMGDGATYTELHLDGAPVAGAMVMPDHVPAQVPPHWLTYFAVADCEATVGAATATGGTVVLEPMDIAPGRMALIHDAQHAMFGVVQLREPA